MGKNHEGGLPVLLGGMEVGTGDCARFMLSL